ncbi:hypothetical protein VSS74_09990 [Conexibacter stalactiti]|uniref:SPW repeat-containing protein n=1 Tax=Conexibacter stalactiti TaxID=1940611 RepID=A0ABU4HPN6_9ACTN|nr:hypothetical protein [Conexibacter stalactiti]MDW5594667.1 hypothetical protein [Conexibacter stalactiti]MEC5035309.1 hypothetical protein [Conexibacter stalactiti]
MTALRPLSLSLHGAFELLLGVLALVAPFALSFTPAGTVLSVLIGVLAIGLALDTTAPRDVTAHQGFDYALAIGAVLVALPLALSADAAAALVLAAIGVAQLALTAGTRYSVRG